MSLRLLSPLGHEHLIDCFLGVETVPSSVTVEVILHICDDVELVAAATTAGDELVHALFALLALLLESSLLLQRRHLVFVDELGKELLFYVLFVLFSIISLCLF